MTNDWIATNVPLDESTVNIWLVENRMYFKEFANISLAIMKRQSQRITPCDHDAYA